MDRGALGMMEKPVEFEVAAAQSGEI